MENEELYDALEGCVDLIEAWMNGVLKEIGFSWHEDGIFPPALVKAKDLLLERDEY